MGLTKPYRRWKCLCESRRRIVTHVLISIELSLAGPGAHVETYQKLMDLDAVNSRKERVMRKMSQ